MRTLRRSVALPALPRRTPLAVAALALAAQGVAAQPADTEVLPGTTLKLTPQLQPPTSRDSRSPLPVILLADRIHGRPDLDTQAEGHVELRRDGTVVRTDRLSYDVANDLAKAQGNVSISRAGNVFRGPLLQLHLQRYEGFFEQPDYFLAITQAGGHAERVNFIDQQRVEAINATYTSCPRDGTGDPAWLLSTDRVRMDFATNTGVAEGAVIRFLGVPILGAPVLSFPLTDERKSGWLPPSITPVDSRNGPTVSVPYYWNIAPNRDATFTPTVMTRRGLALDTEFRYLQPSFQGRIDYNLLPNDRQTGHARHALEFEQEGDSWAALHYRAAVLRVSDDAYWKDFPHAVPSITPRLLPADVRAERPLGQDFAAYARVKRWQVLNDDDPSTTAIAPPYDRAPQLGLAGSGLLLRAGHGGLAYSLETELNHFVLAEGRGTSPVRPTRGDRAHLLGALSWPVSLPGGWITPKLGINAAAYRYRYDDALGTEQSARASRVIPTFSIDSGLVFERDTRWFGRAVRQTLEPRVQYVNTPYREQSDLPNFDAAGRDFNDISVYSDNAFAGIDRVSDTHHIAAGVTARWLDDRSGAELMRLGLVQRYLLRTQRITPAPEGGTSVQGEPFTQRFSDVLLLGSSTLGTRWSFNAAVQYNPDISRPVRSLVGVRYSPGPFRTVNVNYRLTRGSSEQVELGWQWPIYRAQPADASGRSCAGSWYGVGRLNYSMRDSRLTDSLAGIEYDAGCWIGRVVVERVSTGLSEATTRVMLQLELVGLSRLGSNPLKALKDNIPGYRLLREERGAPATGAFYD